MYNTANSTVAIKYSTCHSRPIETPSRRLRFENAFKHPFIVSDLHQIAFLGVPWAIRMVPFPRIPHNSILPTVVKINEIDVILRNENIGPSDITMYESATMNDL